MTTETTPCTTNSKRLSRLSPPWGPKRRLIAEDYSRSALLDGIEHEIKRLWWYLQLQRKEGRVVWHVSTDSEPMKRATREALTTLLTIRADASGRLSYWTRREIAELEADMAWEDDAAAGKVAKPALTAPSGLLEALTEDGWTFRTVAL